MAAAAGLIWVLFLVPSSGEVEAAARKVLENADYQQDMPGEAARPAGDRQADKTRVDGQRRSSRSRPPRIHRPSEGEQIVGWAVLWVVGGVMLALLLVWMVREWGERRNAAASAARPPAVRHEGAATREVMRPGDPEALAREGRFNDAVHALLLGLLLGIEARLTASWTSREIARRAKLPEPAAEPFSGLVQLVERGRFAGESLTSADFERARGWARRCEEAFAA